MLAETARINQQSKGEAWYMIDDYTHIVLVTDRSGSMESIKTDAQGGINTFIKEQKEQSGIATFALYDFDTEHRKVFGPSDIKKFESYALVPRGGTAMLDAIGRAVNETNSFVWSIPEVLRPKNVVFVIVTDGEENSSREYNYETIKKLITSKQELGWKFIFLAGDQDAVLNGAKMGIQYTTNYVNTGASAFAGYTNTSNTVSTLRATGAMNVARGIDSAGNVIE